MFVKSLLGPKAIPDLTNIGHTFVTDDNDVVEVPDELGASLCEQTEAWTSERSAPKSKKEN